MGVLSRGRFLRGLLLAGFLVAVSGSAAAQSEYTILRTIFLPSVFYVGDRVEARITIRTRGDDEPAVPETVPEVAWGDIDSTRLVPREDGWDLRIVFRAFEPGTHSVPDIDLDSIVVSGVDIHVRSILGDSVRELAPPQPQLLLPSTRLMFGIAGGAAVFIPLAWLTFVRWGKKKLMQVISWYRRGRPYRKLTKSLRLLRVSAAEADGRVFYRDLMKEMRTYLSEKLTRDCMSATTSELGEYLAPVVRNVESRREIVGVFRAGDLVKFAGRLSSVDERASHVDFLERAAAEIEAEQKAEESHVGR